MNRIQSVTQQMPEFSSFEDRVLIDQASISQDQQLGVEHSLFLPMHYEKKYAYPLIVWLHSDADDERQLVRIMPLMSMRNYVSIAPRGNQPCDDCPGFEWSLAPSSVQKSQQAISECISVACEKANINSRRIFIGGYGSGGTMALRLGLMNPHRYAGILSLGGSFPEHSNSLANIKQSRSTPLFISHGRDSSDYPVEQMCEDLRLYHISGFSVTLRQYPCGDELSTQMLSDMDAWMMEIVNGVDMTKPATEPDEFEPDWGDFN